jgi:AraC-like DNA-binding protein
VQAIEGSYDIALGDSVPLQTGTGGFFIAPSNTQQTIVHHVDKTSGKMSARWIFLDVEMNKSVSLDTLYQFPVVVNTPIKNQLNTLFDRIFDTDDVWQNYSDCYALIGSLLKTATPLPNKRHTGIQRAMAYINENYQNEITIKTLANIANVSESNLYAVFKKHVGVSPIAYLNHYRMSIAAHRLIDTLNTVSEIAYSVGIHDPLYFSKLFKKIYGIPPKEYRLVYQNKQN